MEVTWVAGDANDFGIDLEEGPVLALAPVTGQAAGAQPDDRDLVETMLHATRGRDGLRYRAAEIVVSQGLGPRRQDLSGFGADALGAVDRGAMKQQTVRAVGGVDHLMHAEEAAKGFDPAESGQPQPGQQERKDDKTGEPRRTFGLE